MDCNAIVLLGASGVGKDTLANELVKEFSGTVNAKFSSLSKAIIARMCGVPTSFMEDKQWRDNTNLVFDGFVTKVTPFVLLTALFKGSPNTIMATAQEQFVFNLIGDSFPIFTDIRRLYEFEAVTKHYKPLVIYLFHSEIKGGVNDVELEEIFEAASKTDDYPCYKVCRKPLDVIADTYSRFRYYFKLYCGKFAFRPTLHIYLAKSFALANNAAKSSPYRQYEPLTDLAASLANLAHFYNMDETGYEELVSTAVRNINLKSTTIPPIETDCSLAWCESHFALLPKFRMYARVLVHVLDEASTIYANLTFEKQEILG